MNSIDICEHLLFKIPSLREALFSLDIISEERRVSPIEHQEFKNILLEFENPKIISVIGIVHTTLIIEPKISSRKYPYISVSGHFAEKGFMSKSGLSSHISSLLNIKDFLPQPIIRKIIYISDFSNMEGIIFSEFTKGVWTIDDPLIFTSKNKLRTNAGEISNRILEDF